jgi:predicted alpha/beta hydrolase family esterase
VLASWSPVPLKALPFPSVLVGSRNDPFCSFERSRAFADAWGAEYVDAGLQGHINADSGLGDWPEGHARLRALMA